MTGFSFEVDTLAEDEGVWVPMPELQPNLRVKLRSIRSDVYRKAQNRRFAKLRALGRLSQTRLSAESERITREAIAEACIVDWEHLKDKAGNEVPYSFEQALEFMTDRRFSLFAESVTSSVRSIGVSEEEEEEEIKGN